MYWAEAGQGTYLNGDRLKNPDLDIGGSVLGVGSSPYDQQSIKPTTQSAGEDYGGQRFPQTRLCGSGSLLCS